MYLDTPYDLTHLLRASNSEHHSLQTYVCLHVELAVNLQRKTLQELFSARPPQKLKAKDLHKDSTLTRLFLKCPNHSTQLNNLREAKQHLVNLV